MSANPHTTFAGTAANPFGVIAGSAATKPAADTELSIHSDPLPGRETKPGKYSELFAQMEPGKNLRCQPHQVGTMSKALHNWLKTNDYPGTVRSQRKGKDGLGRVWWLAGTPLQVDGAETITTTLRKTLP